MNWNGVCCHHVKKVHFWNNIESFFFIVRHCHFFRENIWTTGRKILALPKHGLTPPPSSKKSSVCGYFCSDIAIFGHLRGFWGTFWLSRHKKTSQLCQAFVVAFFPPMHYVALQYYLIVSIALLVTGEQLFKYCIAVIMLIPDHKWSYHWSLALARKTLAPWKYFGFRKGLLLYWLRALSINRKRIWLRDRGRHLMLFGFVSNMVGKYIWYHLALYYVWLWLWLWCCSNAMKCNAMLTM